MAKPNFDASDVQENRVKGGVGYVPFLFFLPLILCPNSKYGRFCANQGFIAVAASAVVAVAFWILNLLLGWIPLIGWLVDAVRWLLEAAILLLALYHAFLACSKGDARELPMLGGLRLIK
ncbi:hypothetical protein ACH6CV_07090 [Bacillota bacterium Meth-B3]|nr:hypothetical protein [Christensenellaceae bacterium]MEA5069381.1 hypothetical protein [Christensenellaceae bacterium]